MGIFDRLFGGEYGPAGELERALWRFNQEKSAAAQEASLEVLLRSQLFVPSMKEASDLMNETSFIVQDTGVGPAVLAFTLPERMTVEYAASVGARSGLGVEARWLLENLPDHLGLMINPDLATGLILPAAGLAQFRRNRLRPGG